MFVLGALFASAIFLSVHARPALQGATEQATAEAARGASELGSGEQGANGPAAAAGTQQATKTQRIPLFENDDVKVWKSVIYPNAPLAMHRHEHPRVIVVMSGALAGGPSQAAR